MVPSALGRVNAPNEGILDEGKSHIQERRPSEKLTKDIIEVFGCDGSSVTANS